MPFLKGSSQQELGRDSGKQVGGGGTSEVWLAQKGPLCAGCCFPGRKKKGPEGSQHDWGQSEVVLHRNMSADLLRKIAEVAFLSAEVRHEGLGCRSCQCGCGQ